MADEKDDKVQDSSPDNVNDQTQATESEPKKTDERVPFHKDEKVQEYINRQVEQRWQELQTRQVQAQSQDKGDAMGEYEKEMVEEGVDPKLAKKIVGVFSRMAKAEIGTAISPLQEGMKGVTMSQRIASFAAEHSDMADHKDTMLTIYRNLSQDEQTFIRSSPNGIDFLYSKAKIMSPGTTTGNQYSTGTITTRAAPKVSDKDTTLSKAQKALESGDREGYRNAIAALQK